MDVTVERRVESPPARAAEIMFDPQNDPKWIGGAKRVELLDPGPLRVGSRVRRHGSYFGRAFSWITEVTAFEPDRRLEMSIVEGPMRGAVTYTIRPQDGGAVVSIRNCGAAKFAFPGMAWLVRRSVAADLERFAALIEAQRQAA